MHNLTPRYSSTKHINKQGTIDSKVEHWDYTTIDKEMKYLCYLGILKEGCSAYCTPVMLISRKVTQNKRGVTDFRHLNIRIAKNN